MAGVKVLYRCPDCIVNQTTKLGCTPYIRYRGVKYAVLNCKKCGKKIACSTVDASDERCFYQNIGSVDILLLQNIEGYFRCNHLEDKLTEEEIEVALWKHAVDSYGNVALVYEYDIKSFIKKLLSGMNRGSLYSMTFEELEEESRKVGICVYESAGAICW